MEEKLQFEYLEYSSTRSQAIYLRQPLTVAELKQRFPRLRGIEFEFGRTAFEPLRYDHQAMFAEILEAFDLEEVRIRSLGRATALPDALWKPSLKRLKFNCRNSFELRPPAGFENRIEEIYIQSIDSIVEAVFDTATLETVTIQSFKGSLRGLERARNLKLLNLTAPVLDCDLRCFPQLEYLTLNQFAGLETLPDLSSLKNLREIRLSYLSQLQRLPAGLDQLPNLEKLWLYSLGHTDNQPLPFTPGTLPALKSLSLQNCNFDYSPKNSRAAFPNLEDLFVHDISSEVLSEAFWSPKLRAANLFLTKCTALPPAFWHCVHLEKLSCRLSEADDFGEGWQVFTRLKEANLVSGKLVRRWPDFGKQNPELAQLSVSSVAIGQLPEGWSACPALAEIKIEGDSIDIPGAWSDFPALQTLHLRNAKGRIYLPRTLALLSGLKSLNIGEVDGRTRPQIELITNLHLLLAKTEAPPAQRAVLGYLLFENVGNPAEYDNAFKTSFLQTLNLNASVLKQVIWDHVHLLNAARAVFPENYDFSGKTVFVGGSTKQKKTAYKEKLTALGALWQSKIAADTQVILLGDACPELPEGFWDAPHWFCTEPQLDPILKNAKPGFMQVLETDDLQHVRRLIWSNDPANDRVVLEMMKNGGVPDSLVPDLVVVAKTSKEDNVRNGFRNLLKAIVPPHYRTMLSDSRDLGKVLYRFYGKYPMPESELSQLWVTYYQRSGQGLMSFFSLRASINSPDRALMLQSIWPTLLERAHYLDARQYLLSLEEVEQLLRAPVFQGNLKRLTLNWVGNSFPDALFEHNTLNEMELYCNECGVLPEAIGRLSRLKKVEINSRDLQSLPDALASIKSLKQARFNTLLGADLPVSEAVKTALEGKLWLQKRHFN